MPKRRRTGLHVSAPWRTGTSSSASIVATSYGLSTRPQLLEDDGIDGFDAVDALLEVLRAGPVRERFVQRPVVPEPGEAFGHLRPEFVVDRDPARARRLPKQCLVELVDPPELLDRSL